MQKEDYYKTLGVEKDASDDEIKKAYRKMAKKYHPDANPGDAAAEAKFKEVSEAYETLSDPQKKSGYDQFGHAGANAGFGGGGFGGFGGGGFGSMDDILENFFGGGFGGGGRSRGPRRGADVQTNIRITFKEAFFGTKKDITMPMMESCEPCKGSGAAPGTHPETCRQCNGSGQERVVQQTLLGAMQTVRTCSVCRGEGKIVKTPCKTCSGAGRTKKSKTFEVNIPRGIDNGQSIRLAGKGEAGERGAANGDLFVGINITGHEKFERRGSNIYLNVPISIVQATLGDEIAIPTMEEEEKFTLKPGTQPGTKYTLKGKGFPSVKNNKFFGDLIFTADVKIPTNLSEKQRNILKEFAEESGEEVKSKKGFFDKIKDALD
ncbi:MAG: molecular chaperone DnaJ [Defluviitaleaceae bacterium]|nr:molecular chaperone DnaJ [Defluviitaleaceae bacterium]